MNKKKLIFPIEFNHIEGGMIHSVISLVKFLSEYYDVYILAHKDAEIFKLNLKVRVLPLKNPWSISINSPLQTLQTYNEVRKLIKVFDKDNTIVFTNNVGSELIFAGFGLFPLDLKRVFVSRGGNYEGKTGMLLRQCFKTVSYFIATSHSQKKNLQNVISKINKIKVIHNGVKIKNSELGNILHFNKVIQLSIVGYINSNKNQILAVRAIKTLINKGLEVQLNIYGIAFSDSDKVYEKELLQVISDLDLQDYIVFQGFEKNQIKIYNDTDILLSCSLSEGFGRTIVEAMAFGIPCIGLEESGGLVDIITHEKDGFLIKNDEHELANQISALIENCDLVKRISKAATETYKNKFTEEIMCKNYFKFIQETF